MHYKKIHWLFSLFFPFYRFGGRFFAFFLQLPISLFFIWYVMDMETLFITNVCSAPHFFRSRDKTRLSVCLEAVHMYKFAFKVLYSFRSHIAFHKYIHELFIYADLSNKRRSTNLQEEVRRKRDWDRDRFILWSKTLFFHFSNRPKWNCSCDVFAFDTLAAAEMDLVN